MPTDPSLARLLQLVSPSLPIGGYTYSQGIEWAVEQGWIVDMESLGEWLSGLLRTSLYRLELPLLVRMMDAWDSNDRQALQRWNDYLLASRESAELRREERNRARALSQLLASLHDDIPEDIISLLRQTQHGGFSYACLRWGINREQACYGLGWSWLENLVLAAVKIIPLGQTDGQRLLFQLADELPGVVTGAIQLEDGELGASPLAACIASCRHETQYTRLFRS